MTDMSKREDLLARRQRLQTTLPPVEEILRGSFFVRSRRCGRPQCHCARDSGHRTALVGVTYADGSTEQIVVPASLERLARTWVGNYQNWWKTIERISTINRELLRRRLVGPTE